MPDVPGEYELQMTVTDGCLVAAARFLMTSSWSDRCEAARRSAATALTAGPALVTIAMLFVSFRVLRTTPRRTRTTPATVREIATRLRRWEARKMRVKFDRLRDSWELRAHRDALRLAVQAHVHAKRHNPNQKRQSKTAIRHPSPRWRWRRNSRRRVARREPRIARLPPRCFSPPAPSRRAPRSSSERPRVARRASRRRDFRGCDVIVPRVRA